MHANQSTDSDVAAAAAAAVAVAVAVDACWAITLMSMASAIWRRISTPEWLMSK